MQNSHELIPARIKALLLNQTDAGDRVTTNRADPIWQAAMPALSIYTRYERSEREVQAPAEFRRTLRVAVEVYVKEVKGKFLDTSVRAMVRQVECALGRDRWLGAPPNCASEWGGEPSEVEIDTDAAGEKLNGAARITWEYPYSWKPNSDVDPTVDGVFYQAHVEFDQAPVGDHLDSEDDTTLSQA